LAALLDDGALHIWQMADRTRLTTIESGASPFVSVAWSPDASQIAIGTGDGTIGIWDVAAGTVLETLEGHTDAIDSLYWIADGSQIISASADGSIRVWEVEVAVTVRPQQATPTPAPAEAGTAIVAVETLNVRAGPSTSFERIGQVKRGEELIVIGQVNSCAWLQVSTPAIPRGWVAGGAQFVTLETNCALIPAPSTPSALTATPTSGVTTQATEEPLPTLTPVDAAQPSPTPPPPPAPEQPAQPTAVPVDPFPADQGCYLFQNQLGPELTIIFTNTVSTSNETFPVPAGQEVPRCFTPGSYIYTIDPLPPYAAITGTLDVQAGVRFMFPIRSQ
jgi:serine protease Do